MHTEVHRPARTMRLLPISLIFLITAASSQVFIDVRSSSAWPGNGSVTSLNIGPENVFAATVVRMVGTLKIAAARAASPALLRKVMASIEWVANDICDWKSIMTRAWSRGVSRLLPGVGVAVMDMMRLLVMLTGGAGTAESLSEGGLQKRCSDERTFRQQRSVAKLTSGKSFLHFRVEAHLP